MQKVIAKEDKRRLTAYRFLIFASFFLYIILTASKNIYVAEKLSLVETGKFGTLTDLASTMEYYFYTYAATQIILCFFMKKLNIKWFLTIMLSISGVLTIVIAFTQNITQQWIIFAINGIAQAGIWGCVIKILGKYLPEKMLPSANKLMTSGPAVAGVIAYGTSAAFGDSWPIPFILLGSLLLFAVATYFISVTVVSKYPREIEVLHVVNKDGSEQDVLKSDDNDFIHLNSKKRVVVFYIASIVMGLLVTAFFFSLNNILDVYLRDIGGFNPTTAKLLTVLAPVLIIVGPFFTVNACEKHKNFLWVAVVIFSISLIFPLLLIFLFDIDFIYLPLAIYLGFLIFTNGGRSISLSIAALKVRDKIDTGIYSSLVNASASISTGIAPKILTKIIDNPNLSTRQNWLNSFIVTLCIGVFTVLLLIALALWVRRLNKKDKQKSLTLDK